MDVKTTLIISLCLLISSKIIAQHQPLKTNIFYPKDSLKFNEESDFEFGYASNLYGKTTMIVRTRSDWGEYHFLFKKKIKNVEKFGGDSSNIFGTKLDGSWGVVRKDYNESYTISDHNLYAFILLSDHGGIIEKVKFQDFGNVVYFPEFDYPNCFISDENKDGIPEFYISYMGNSDGLDAKAYKQIIYTFTKTKNEFVKSKATAYYPAGNPEDEYYEEFDANWKLLPERIQRRSKKILTDYKMKF
jgi:hypothetical protein